MTELNFAHITPEDLQFIIDKLWDRGVEEAVLYGLKTPEELYQHFIGVSRQHGYCLKVGDEPVAAFGVTPPKGKKYSTWFIATERFSEAGLGITKFLRGFVRERLAEHPEAELELVSAVGHPDATRWFNALGFTQQGAPNGVFTRYLYTKGKSRLTST